MKTINKIFLVYFFIFLTYSCSDLNIQENTSFELKGGIKRNLPTTAQKIEEEVKSFSDLFIGLYTNFGEKNTFPKKIFKNLKSTESKTDESKTEILARLFQVSGLMKKGYHSNLYHLVANPEAELSDLLKTIIPLYYPIGKIQSNPPNTKSPSSMIFPALFASEFFLLVTQSPKVSLPLISLFQLGLHLISNDKGISLNLKNPQPNNSTSTFNFDEEKNNGLDLNQIIGDSKNNFLFGSNIFHIFLGAAADIIVKKYEIDENSREVVIQVLNESYGLEINSSVELSTKELYIYLIYNLVLDCINLIESGIIDIKEEVDPKKVQDWINQRLKDQEAQEAAAKRKAELAAKREEEAQEAAAKRKAELAAKREVEEKERKSQEEARKNVKAQEAAAKREAEEKALQKIKDSLTDKLNTKDTTNNQAEITRIKGLIDMLNATTVMTMESKIEAQINALNSNN